MESIKELLNPKAFNKLSFVAVIFWILLGVALLGIFAEMEISESRLDFHCDTKLGGKDFTRGQCFDKYEKQYNKLSIPVYAFVTVNVCVIAVVCVIYSRCVNSSVDEVIEAERNRQPSANLEVQHGVFAGKRLFIAYCVQLALRIALGIVFVILQTKVLYPASFPSNFACNLGEDETSKEVNSSAANFTRTQTYKCHNQRATKKTFWTYAVAVVNGIFAFLVFIEIVYILLRARNDQTFMENSQFYAVHLKSSPGCVPEEPQDQIPILSLQGSHENQEDQPEQDTGEDATDPSSHHDSNPTRPKKAKLQSEAQAPQCTEAMIQTEHLTDTLK